MYSLSVLLSNKKIAVWVFFAVLMLYQMVKIATITPSNTIALLTICIITGSILIVFFHEKGGWSARLSVFLRIFSYYNCLESIELIKFNHIYYSLRLPNKFPHWAWYRLRADYHIGNVTQIWANLKRYRETRWSVVNQSETRWSAGRAPARLGSHLPDRVVDDYCTFVCFAMNAACVAIAAMFLAHCRM